MKRRNILKYNPLRVTQTILIMDAINSNQENPDIVIINTFIQFSYNNYNSKLKYHLGICIKLNYIDGNILKSYYFYTHGSN